MIGVLIRYSTLKFQLDLKVISDILNSDKLHYRLAVKALFENHGNRGPSNVFINGSYFDWLRFTDVGSVPEMRTWFILFIKSDLKWCIHLDRSLFLYIINEYKSVRLVLKEEWFNVVWKVISQACSFNLAFVTKPNGTVYFRRVNVWCYRVFRVDCRFVGFIWTDICSQNHWKRTGWDEPWQTVWWRNISTPGRDIGDRGDKYNV